MDQSPVDRETMQKKKAAEVLRRVSSRARTLGRRRIQWIKIGLLKGVDFYLEWKAYAVISRGA